MKKRDNVWLIGIGLLLLALGIWDCMSLFPPNTVPISTDTASEALEYALFMLGVPYKWAGQDPSGFDCSGLIVWAYQQVCPNIQFRVGNKVVADVTMVELYRYNTEPLPYDDIRPGDIIFISDTSGRITHGGLFVRWVSETEFEFVNASSYAGEVRLDIWPIDGWIREQKYAGAGRLLTVY